MDTKHIKTCPCGSTLKLAQCCGKYHAGEAAPTALVLMRSRYSAFVLGLNDYLYKTWSADTRPNLEDLGGTGLNWINLQIINCKQGLETDNSGEVRFIASYTSGNKGKHLEENSRFIRSDGAWVYVDGDCTVSDISRNEPCPCGSGKKFKRCCMQGG